MASITDSLLYTFLGVCLPLLGRQVLQELL